MSVGSQPMGGVDDFTLPRDLSRAKISLCSSAFLCSLSPYFEIQGTHVINYGFYVFYGICRSGQKNCCFCVFEIKCTYFGCSWYE